MDFHYHGQRIRESTEQTKITRARQVQANRKQQMRDGVSGYREPEKPKLISVAAKEWIESKVKWSPKTRKMAEAAMKNLLPVLGKKLVVDIKADDIAKYRNARLETGVANRTVNIEVGCLRSVLKKNGAWARLQPHVDMLPEREDAGHALAAEEESALLAECGKSRSRLLHPFIVLALETGSRYGTLRRLKWKNIDFANRCLTFGKDKTRAGSGRTIPLSQRAIETLQFWAQQFPNRQKEHYVFPYEKCGGAGTDDVFGFTGSTVYESDPAKPFGSLKVAWEAARKRAGLPHLRMHDLRHTAASRMMAARYPLPMIGKILGWRPGTLARMADRYGHFSVEEMRSAVESISGKPEVSSGYPKNPPKYAQNSTKDDGEKLQ
jgi:integrase